MENLPLKGEKNIFCKIKQFFIKIFHKEIINEKKQNTVDTNSIDTFKNNTTNLKIEKDILDTIEKNPELIYSLSNEKLENLIRII